MPSRLSRSRQGRAGSRRSSVTDRQLSDRGGGSPASRLPPPAAARAFARALLLAACAAFAGSCQDSGRQSATEQLLLAELERTRSELQRKCLECDQHVQEMNRLQKQLKQLGSEVEALKARLASSRRPAPAPASAPKHAAPAAPPRAADSRGKLVLFDGYAGRSDSRQYSKLQVEAAKEGASMSFAGSRFPDLGRFGGAIVVGGAGGHNHSGYDGLQGPQVVRMHTFVRSGGRLVFFVLPRMSDFNTTLQDTFRVTMALEDVTPRAGYEMHLEGGKLCRLWDGLTIGALASYKDKPYVSAPALCSYFVPLERSFRSTAIASAKTGKRRATSVEGTIGGGKFLFLTNVANGGGGCQYRTGSTPVADVSFDAWDNQEAARRLIAWLTEN